MVQQEKGNYPSIGQYLTREQANFVYKKTESGEIINTETLQPELEYERQLDKIYPENMSEKYSAPSGDYTVIFSGDVQKSKAIYFQYL